MVYTVMAIDHMTLNLLSGDFKKDHLNIFTWRLAAMALQIKVLIVCLGLTTQYAFIPWWSVLLVEETRIPGENKNQQPKTGIKSQVHLDQAM